MKAMVLERPGTPLREVDVPIPVPTAGGVLVKVHACAVCRTDLHVIDGDLTRPKLPLVPGHEIVGTIAMLGDGVTAFDLGDRIGIPWLGHTCGCCHYCKTDRENLCDDPGLTGYQIDGGYAEYTVADAAYCFRIHGKYSDAEAAPLMCAGLIGHRALRMTGEAQALGIYGFGAAAHIVAQIAQHEDRRVFAFTSPGDQAAQGFARSLGCTWAGSSLDPAPEPLDAAILFAPVGPLVPLALKAVRKGGTVVLGGIHMSDIPAMPYEILWGERIIRSVANLTRDDAIEFLELAPQVPIQTHVTEFPLHAANDALDKLRHGQLTGAAVLIP